MALAAVLAGVAATAHAKNTDALLSVYYHADQAALGGAAPATTSDLPFEVLPTVEAARVLHADRSRNGLFRQRRSIAKLAAAGGDREDFRAAIRVLLDGDETTMRDITRELAGNTEEGIPVREARVGDLLEDTYGAVVPGCRARNMVTDIQCRPDLFTITIPSGKVTVEINRPVKDIARAFDGQNWDECSNLFGPTYVARKVGGVYDVDANNDAYPEPHPKKPGTKWSGVLFETAEMEFQGISRFARFKTLLDVQARFDTVRGRKRYVFEYDLHESVWSSLLWFSSWGGILQDYGYLSATESSQAGWSVVENTKTVQFANPATNVGACALLRAKSDAVVELACCNPPEP